ncbi:unnamed protein product [Ectocarpus sp. 12 AP-2014]
MVQVGNDPLYLDALLKGYPTRFLNHSCDLNAYLYTARGPRNRSAYGYVR